MTFTLQTEAADMLAQYASTGNWTSLDDLKQNRVYSLDKSQHSS